MLTHPCTCNRLSSALGSVHSRCDCPWCSGSGVAVVPAFVCVPCKEARHADCPGSTHCDCQHRTDRK